MQVPVRTLGRFRVGEFEVDLRCGEVRRNGDKIKLQQRPFQILAALLQHPGEVVTREEIRLKLWPTDIFVDFEHSINTAVNKLREALGDNAENPRFIETLPRYGYRLLTPVEILDGNGGPPQVEAMAVSLPERDQDASSTKRRSPLSVRIGALLTVSVAALFLSFAWYRPRTPSGPAWMPITKFSDSTTSPALSPDGRTIAFIRGPETFVTPGQVYVKTLPDGEPVQLTHDSLPKMAPAFSPDGTRIAYTATSRNFEWNTWVVPVLGGEPQKLMPNAAALTWADGQHVVFSEMKSGLLMGIETATESRADQRDIYMPAYIGGMAHRSWVSPDRKWILVSEMDSVGWRPCRVVPFDGSTGGETVGPKDARCTYAGWSADGKMMYFSADAGDGYHIWRQKFPAGVPEQMTFGPTEEEGIAVSPDGRTLVTSAGIKESSVWVHDSRGDRQISGEGFATVPGLGLGSGPGYVFSPDGKKLFYLVRKQASRAWAAGELWVSDLDSRRSEAVLPGISMSNFHILPDGERVAYAAPDSKGNSHVWLAWLDRRTSPTQLSSFFSYLISAGPGGDIYFLAREGNEQFLYTLGPAEDVPRKISSKPVTSSAVISPQGDWLLAVASPVMARPIQGGPPIRICNFCNVGWGAGGKFLYIRLRDVGEMGGGKTIVVGLSPGKEFPTLPSSGLTSVTDTKGLNVAAVIDTSGMVLFAPGPNPSIYAYSRVTVQRNLYRIPVN